MVLDGSGWSVLVECALGHLQKKILLKTNILSGFKYKNGREAITGKMYWN